MKPRFGFIALALAASCQSETSDVPTQTPNGPSAFPTNGTNSSVPTFAPSSNTTSSTPTVSPTQVNTTEPTTPPTLAPSQSNITESPTTSPSAKPTDATMYPTVAPSPSPSSTPPHEKSSIGKVIARTFGWLILIALSVLVFGAAMSNRYQIYYALRGVWFTILQMECTRWILVKLHVSGRWGGGTNTSLNEIIFDSNDLSEGLLMGDT